MEPPIHRPQIAPVPRHRRPRANRAGGDGFPRDAQLADQLSAFGFERARREDEALERLMIWAEDSTRPQAVCAYVRARLVDLREA